MDHKNTENSTETFKGKFVLLSWSKKDETAEKYRVHSPSYPALDPPTQNLQHRTPPCPDTPARDHPKFRPAKAARASEDVQRTPNVCCEDIFNDENAQRPPQFNERAHKFDAKVFFLSVV